MPRSMLTSRRSSTRCAHIASLSGIASCREILENESDEDLRKLAREEKARPKSLPLEREPAAADPARRARHKDVIMEIRAATGGEAALPPICSVCTRYDSKRWRYEI
jgi:protein subunit release factor A